MVLSRDFLLWVWNTSHTVYDTLWKSLAGIFLSSAKPVLKCQNL